MIEDQTNTIDESQQESNLVQDQDLIDELAGTNSSSRIKLKLKDLNVILSLMFTLALGGVYLLGMNTSLAEANPEQQAAEQKIELALAKMISAADALKANAKEKKLINDTINYKVTDRHIPHGLLSGNPFIYKLDWASPEIESGNGSSGQDNPDSYANAAVGRMAIQSILASDAGGIALINECVVHVGDQINGWTIKAITSESVILQFKNQTRTLYLK